MDFGGGGLEFADLRVVVAATEGASVGADFPAVLFEPFARDEAGEEFLGPIADVVGDAVWGVVGVESVGDEHGRVVGGMEWSGELFAVAFAEGLAGAAEAGRVHA